MGKTFKDTKEIKETHKPHGAKTGHTKGQRQKGKGGRRSLTQIIEEDQ